MSIDYNKPLNFHGIGRCYFRSVAFRRPRTGEWYLSGAIIEGYRAPNDLPTSYLVVEPTYHARSVQARYVKAEFRDRSGNLRDLFVRMGPGVRCIRQEPLDRPEFDLRCVTRRRGLRPRAPARPLRKFGLRHQGSLAERERACDTGGARHRRIGARDRLPWLAGPRVPPR